MVVDNNGQEILTCCTDRLIFLEVGFSLRKDDPAALKELVSTIQLKTSEKQKNEA